ncbi:hypothetical protein F5879DRAFT_991176 [Lentinula edodes]|nr:hypothetical protein F5879DRAFT_991176 [Lentinula edodes]
MEVNKDFQNSDEGPDILPTSLRLLGSLPLTSGSSRDDDLEWPRPFPFTTWEEALGLSDLFDFHQVLHSDSKGFTDGDGDPASQNTAFIQPDYDSTLPPLADQVDWYSNIATPVDWDALLYPQVGNATAEDIAPLSSLPNGPSIMDSQAHSSFTDFQDIEVADVTSQFSPPGISLASGNVSSRLLGVGVGDMMSSSELTVRPSPAQSVHPVSPANNTTELLSLFPPQAAQPSDSRPQPRQSLRSHKSKPYAVPTKHPISQVSELQEMELVVVQARDFDDLCQVSGVNRKDLTFILDRGRSCYTRYKNYRTMRDFLIPLGFTNDKTWKALTRMGVYYAKSETQHSESLVDILHQCKWQDRTWDDKRQYYSWAEDAPKYMWNDLYPRSPILEGTEYIKDKTNLYNHFVRIKYAFDSPGYFNINCCPRASGGDYYETRTAELTQESIKRYRKLIDRHIIKVTKP